MSVPIPAVIGLVDPAQSFKFRITFSPLPTVVAAVVDSDEIRLRIESGSIPANSIEQTQVNYQGYTLRFGGRVVNNGSWNVTWTESNDNKILRAMRNWQDLINSYITGFQATSLSYKTTATVELLDGNNNTTSKWRVIGVWMQDLSETRLDYNSSDAIKVSCTFSYDYTTNIPL